ncbi:hypothetical protein VIGAN_01346900 [Vigna angularis var. angularis]|uniref:Uncharacterized protein n=1 Tax=Vigna angularis var. angularis TaxID=157739 RepID=A0A0S3R4X3_PHAAN|nr:hypothetical protein VIGAN_01346900 [Vigna angularis var. angularis]
MNYVVRGAGGPGLCAGFGHSEGTNLVNGMKYFGSVFVRRSRSHSKCITSRDRSSTYHPDECLLGIVASIGYCETSV